MYIYVVHMYIYIYICIYMLSHVLASRTPSLVEKVFEEAKAREADGWTHRYRPALPHIIMYSYVYMYMDIYICIYIYIYTCVYAYMYEYVYRYTHTYIYAPTRPCTPHGLSIQVEKVFEEAQARESDGWTHSYRPALPLCESGPLRAVHRARGKRPLGEACRTRQSPFRASARLAPSGRGCLRS